MRILSISKGGREIVNGTLGWPMILIGRSPTCEIVLRVKTVRPVHYLVEWVGAGDFDSTKGAWTIFDISGASGIDEKQYKSVSSGEGVVIGEKPVTVGGFEFRLRTDRLMETRLEGGALHETFQEKKMISPSPSNAYQLEVVSIRRDSGFLTNVLHLNESGDNRRRVIPHVPPISVEWSSEAKGVMIQIDNTRLRDADVFLGKAALLAGRSENVSQAKLVPGELIQIRWQKFDHYFRLVPKIEVPPVPLALLKDPFYRWALAVVLLMGSVFFGLRNLILIPPEAIAVPPRIARVELKNVDVKQMQTPPAPPPPAVDKAVEVKPAVEAAEKAAVDKSSLNAKYEVPHEKKAAGVNAPSAQANVNSIGLLGALKPQKSAVTADKVINDGIISKSVSHADGQFTVQQPPAGNIAKQAAASPGLSAAYTTMDKEDSQVGTSVSVLTGDEAKNPTKAYTNSGVESSGEFSANGGLDKEAIRRALATYRKDFRTCYEQALMLKPRITGRIVYKWQITPSGAVEWVNLLSSNADAPNLADCVQKVIKVIPFPKAPNHQPTDVIYPFVFQTKS